MNCGNLFPRNKLTQANCMIPALHEMADSQSEWVAGEESRLTISQSDPDIFLIS